METTIILSAEMSSFPIIKLVSLTIKQLSKPMAAFIKRKAKDSYLIRTYLCTPPAQCMYVYIVTSSINKYVWFLVYGMVYLYAQGHSSNFPSILDDP